MAPSSNYEDVSAAASGSVTGNDAKRPYYGKCQYKTGKCFNERTLKRNGDAHSLCEEHRIKQNLIQRRSDRKYQTVHAIRRRERSQRRAVLKKQVSMAVAQQLFYEHQQQKSIGMHQLSGHSLNALASAHAASSTSAHVPPALASHSPHVASLAPPIQIPGKMDLSHQHHHPLYSHNYHHFADPSSFLSSGERLVSPILSFAKRASRFSEEAAENERMGADDEDERENDDHGDEDNEDDMEETRTEAGETVAGSQRRRSGKEQQFASLAADQVKEEHESPTGIDDFAPDSFLSICVSSEDNDAAYANLVPIMSTMSEKEMWTEDDIEFLQNLLLA
uniref:Uncharacterized protein n=1 Tax=Globisporangium ultimum (strain ATCC 200006 / CBS 805.95 / DAOM BR144) TaxID=431595 RepID=K3W844_GLOUD